MGGLVASGGLIDRAADQQLDRAQLHGAEVKVFELLQNARGIEMLVLPLFVRDVASVHQAHVQFDRRSSLARESELLIGGDIDAVAQLLDELRFVVHLGVGK